MKLYFFYTPDENRDECRTKGIIGFKLDALYCQDAYSDKVNKDVKSFSYFDQIRCRVSTKTEGYYNFRVETGKDLDSGHYAKSEKELLEAYKGAIKISEKNYLRLRKVAIALLFRHTQFFNPLDEESKYLWSNESYESFWSLRLTALNYKYNTKGHDDDFLKYLKERDLPLNDCGVPEEIRLHIAKPKKKATDRPFKCSTFEITGRTYCRYYDFQDAIKSLNRLTTTYEEIENFQYDRIRKICQALMFEYSELEFSELKKPQTNFIRILNI